MTDEASFLTAESLERYFRLGVVSVFQLSAKTQAHLEIDPTSEQLRLFVPAKDGLPEVRNFERIRVDRMEGVGAGSRYRLVFQARGMRFAAYQLIESIVGHLEEGDTFQHAVGESISDLKRLLASRSSLTIEKETGLWGELYIFEYLLRRIGEKAAFETWLGPEGAEHDFAFSDFEAEVKTTRSETRRHMIGSETQLDPSPGRPLYLISIQITLAGAAGHGRTLPRLVSDVRDQLTESSGRFDRVLREVGYDGVDADLYQSKFQLRSVPRAYVIEDSFPSITRAKLKLAIPGCDSISDVSYRLDVTALPPVELPAPLDEFCEVDS
jgi:hypothetical protein